jgi:hypothetical protein
MIFVTRAVNNKYQNIFCHSLQKFQVCDKQLIASFRGEYDAWRTLLRACEELRLPVCRTPGIFFTNDRKYHFLKLKSGTQIETPFIFYSLQNAISTDHFQ